MNNGRFIFASVAIMFGLLVATTNLWYVLVLQQTGPFAPVSTLFVIIGICLLDGGNDKNE